VDRGAPDPIQVTGNLRNGILHEFGSGALIGEKSLRPMTGLFPNPMTGQSHVGPDRPSRTIHVAVPPRKSSPYTRHHGTIDSRRSVTHDEMLKITSGPDGSVHFGDELRFLRDRFTCQREQPCNTTAREHDTRRFDYETPLGRASGDGRETVQIAGLERCLSRSPGVEENMMRP
jgi:hypothetical protein